MNFLLSAKAFLSFVCLYELGGLHIGWWPTFTTLVWESRGRTYEPAVWLIVAACLVWCAWHLFFEGR